MSTQTLAIAVQPLRGAWQAWNRFWFEPTSTLSIAVFRILYGGLILVFLALLAPDRSVWFSDSGPFTAQPRGTPSLTASACARSHARSRDSRRRSLMLVFSPTFALHRNTTPSSSISAIRLSTTHFSSLKSGMP